MQNDLFLQYAICRIIKYIVPRQCIGFLIDNYLTIMDKFVDAVVERTHFISKLSFDCCYFFATAKAEVKVSGSDSTRMYQFRDLSIQ